MTITPNKFTRKTFSIEAILVTRENMHDVAEWCGGKVNSTFENGQEPGSFVRVPISQPRNHRPDMAFPEKHWVLRTNSGYSVYTKPGFESSFVLVMLDNAKRYADVHTLVWAAMIAQDAATYHGDTRGMDILADATVKKILNIL
jgi:hypothetical protein